MKSFLKYSKLGIGTLVIASAFVACSDDDEPAAYTTPYTANTSNIKTAGKAVDLGLPSGTKWADMNVGAASEADNGILFVWGDITGSQIAPVNYIDVTKQASAEDLFNKYKASEQSTGYLYDTTCVYKEEITGVVISDSAEFVALVDKRFNEVKAKITGKSEILSKNGETGYSIVINSIDSTAFKYYQSNAGFDKEKGADYNGIAIYDLIANAKLDPATANWGSAWSMPTKEQMKELIDNCTWEFEANGYRVKSKANDNSIFLPAAGFRYGNEVVGNGTAGYYASGSILGNYHFPSMLNQVNNDMGSINGVESMPYYMIFQHGQFDNTISLNNSLTINYAVSIRPVTK